MAEYHLGDDLQRDAVSTGISGRMTPQIVWVQFDAEPRTQSIDDLSRGPIAEFEDPVLIEDGLVDDFLGDDLSLFGLGSAKGLFH